jgi:hypothetical protein
MHQNSPLLLEIDILQNNLPKVTGNIKIIIEFLVVWIINLTQKYIHI